MTNKEFIAEAIEKVANYHFVQLVYMVDNGSTEEEYSIPITEETKIGRLTGILINAQIKEIKWSPLRKMTQDQIDEAEHFDSVTFQTKEEWDDDYLASLDLLP